MVWRSQEQQDRARESMVARHIADRGIKDDVVLQAMRSVPREAFMPQEDESGAYADKPSPIGCGQTISQPFIVAMMAQLAELKPEDKVLEIGTGSGYGAAVIASIAGHVFTIERHEELAARAEATLRGLGYDNVTVLRGDGTLGWADEAPFDAIVVTAGAPSVPEILKQQLAPGGRLVIPAGTDPKRQTLYQVIKVSDDDYITHDYGHVAFVPLIGEHGWRESGGNHPRSRNTAKTKEKWVPLSRLLRQDAEPIPEPDSPHFGQFFDRLGEADIVLLGESTHGTAEFYRARAAITQRLVLHHGFNIVALEADWPDVAVIDGYVRNIRKPDIGMISFSRFPEWMWRNQEFKSFVNWLKKYNDRQAKPSDKIGIYGLDLYSMKASMNAVINFLEDKDPGLADVARRRYSCFDPWAEDPAAYGQTVITAEFMSCERAAIRMLMDLMSERDIYIDGYRDNLLDVTRNAELVVNAEKYYRVMYLGLAESWNLRDRHMFNTLRAIKKSRWPKAKTVVWAHNSHIGDARATEMGTMRGEINLGQLCRENYGDRARLVGFGTATGEAIAAQYWGGPAEVISLRPPVPGSHEALWEKTGMDNALLDMTRPMDITLRTTLKAERMQRAVGVVYRPESERGSHYFNACPALQYDYYVWFNKTNPVTPLPAIPETGGVETYPFGL